VIPHGNYDSYPRKSEEHIEIEIDIPDDGFCYLHFGSIRPYKGTMNLVEAFSSIAKEEDRLLIVGRRSNEKYAQKLESAVNNNRMIELKFKYVKNEQFGSIAKVADAMVLPYEDILTSGAAHLALSFGLPVVAPKVGCLPETVPDEAGVLYTSGGLREAMATVKNLETEKTNETAIKKMKQRAWASIASKTEDVYHDVV